MDFSRLPDPAFLKIFEYLPFEDCIRVGRVNKPFRRIAQLFISRTKSLDLTEVSFRNLKGHHLSVILDLCSPNLEKIKFMSTEILDLNSQFVNPSKWQRQYDALENQGKQLVTVFANYQCPLLTDIGLGCNSIDGGVFEQLILNNPNMESLVWKGNFVAYPAVTNTKLKKLKLQVDGPALQSMIGRFPNLKELDLETRDDDITSNVFNEFFGSVPQVHQLNISLLGKCASIFCLSTSFDRFYFGPSFQNDLANFWNLPLTSLSIRFICQYYPADTVLYDLAKSFPHLRQLHIDTLDPSPLLVPAMTSLASLKELELLELRLMRIEDGYNHDQGIRRLAQCEKLQKLVMCNSSITGGTLINLLRSCPQLDHIVIWDITEVANPEEAAVILESLAGIPRRDINIEFRSYEVTTVKSIWDAEHVKEVIGKLEDIDGLKIKLTWIKSQTKEGGQEIADLSLSDLIRIMTKSMNDGIDE